MTHETLTKKNLEKYYTNSMELLIKTLNTDKMQANINEFKQYKTHVFCFRILDHIKELTAGMPYELLTNINYHSIIWEYLNADGAGMTNQLMNVFKHTFFDGVAEFTSQSKLNNLTWFNSCMAVLMFIYNQK